MKSPASPALSLVNSSTDRALAPASRLPGSVHWDKQSVLRPAIRTLPSRDRFSSNAAIEPGFYRLGSKHMVFQSLQRPKLLMGCELELAKLAITVTVLLFLFAVMKFSLDYLLMAFIFGGPVMWVLRMLSEQDPDYAKVYVEALQISHVREPE